MKSKINNARSERSRNNGRIIQLMIESLSVVLEQTREAIWTISPKKRKKQQTNENGAHCIL